MRTICRLFPLAALLLVSATPHGARAQQYMAQEAAAGLQTVSSRTHLFSGPSGAYTWNFSPHAGLDTNFAWITGYQQGGYADDGHELLFTAGIKAGWRSQRWGIFGRVAPGLASFDHGVGVAYYPSTTFTWYRRTHFALDDGAVVEYYPTRHTLIRLDAEQTLLTEFDQVVLRQGPFEQILEGHVASHLGLGLSAGYRFGERQIHSTPRARSAVPRFDLGALYALHLRTHLLSWDLEPNGGSGAWGDYNFSRWGAVDVTAFDLPHDDHTANFQDGGKTFEAYAGLKAGFRTRRFGYFAKFRQGAIRFGRTLQEEDFTSTTFFVRFDKFYDLAFDTGGVLEFYPWKHLVLRTDIGDDVIWYRPRTVTENGAPASISGQSASSFLFLTGVGLRF